MAVPKKQTSHARKGWRRSHWHLTAPSQGKCPHCGAPCRAHRVCRECGHYGKREVLVVKS